MDYFSTFEISRTGMALEKARLDASVANLASMNRSAAPGTTPFRPLRVLSQALALDFQQQLDRAGGTELLQVVEQDRAPRMVFDPGHPHADAKGFVAYPGVDQATEMMTLNSALRSYEANMVALNVAKTMAARALDLGGSQ